MSLSSYYDLSWNDSHTQCLSRLYSLYFDEIFWEDQLLDIGYNGHPDPTYDLDAGVSQPDFIAYNTDGDVQHISIIDIDATPPENEKELIESELSQLEKYEEISEEMINKFLSLRNKSLSVNHQETVALVTDKTYNNHRDKFKSVVQELGIILWSIKEQDTPLIKKVSGEHASIELNRMLNSGVNVFPDGDDLLYFSRNTDSSLIEFEFIQRLLTYCSRETKREFTFDEVDEIMIRTRPPMLRHIPQNERIEYWKEYVYRLLNDHQLLEQTGSDRYQWKKKRFTSEPRDRKRILSKIKDKLRPGEE
ncbi:hypothetical protein [Halohasta litorea]|uniref:Uncharacterized protein n=1 Tax=Halohasta litorea TaxID=869891 RepID=A0ABD6D742_9EURY|nr:hypothetical protein [Halohasta litorea]